MGNSQVFYTVFKHRDVPTRDKIFSYLNRNEFIHFHSADKSLRGLLLNAPIKLTIKVNNKESIKFITSALEQAINEKKEVMNLYLDFRAYEFLPNHTIGDPILKRLFKFLEQLNYSLIIDQKTLVSFFSQDKSLFAKVKAIELHDVNQSIRQATFPELEKFYIIGLAQKLDLDLQALAPKLKALQIFSRQDNRLFAIPFSFSSSPWGGDDLFQESKSVVTLTSIPASLETVKIDTNIALKLAETLSLESGLKELEFCYSWWSDKLSKFPKTLTKLHITEAKRASLLPLSFDFIGMEKLEDFSLACLGFPVFLSLPPSLKKFSMFINENMNESINLNQLIPASLEELSLNFNDFLSCKKLINPLEGERFSKLQKLALTRVNMINLPPSLTELSFKFESFAAFEAIAMDLESAPLKKLSLEHVQKWGVPGEVVNQGINYIRRLPVSLKELYLQGEPFLKLEAENLADLSLLEKLTLINVHGIKKLPASLKELHVEFGNIKAANLAGLQALEKLSLKNFQGIKKLPASLKELRIEFGNIKATSLAGLSALEKLSLKNFQGIKKLPVSLKELHIEEGDLKAINLADLPALEKLSLRNVQGIKKLPVSLKELHIEGQPPYLLDLEATNLAGLSALEKLSLRNVRGIKILPTSLKELNINGQLPYVLELEATDLVSLPALEKLSLRNVRGIKKLPVSLKELEIEGPSHLLLDLGAINLADLSYLKKLTIIDDSLIGNKRQIKTLLSRFPKNLFLLKMGKKDLLQANAEVQNYIVRPYQISEKDAQKLVDATNVLLIYTHYYAPDPFMVENTSQQEPSEIRKARENLDKRLAEIDESYNKKGSDTKTLFYDENINALPSLEEQLFPPEEESWLAPYPDD